MLAKDVMTTRVVTVMEDTPVEEVVRTLLKWRISAVPVVDFSDRLVGVVSEGNLVHRSDSEIRDSHSWWLSGVLEPEEQTDKFARARKRLAKDVMTTQVVTASENDSLVDIAALLEKRRIKRVPILRRGKLTGIVSRANILHGIPAAPEPLSEDSVPPAAAKAPDDDTIRATILSRLHNDIRVSGSINVIVSGGVVDLWGGVEKEEERQTIRMAAEDAKGVSKVRDNLYVMPPALRHLLGADRLD
ncbi:MAG: CBS domain-containing protein [Candidatus Rariloculaceae bacterium]